MKTKLIKAIGLELADIRRSHNETIEIVAKIQILIKTLLVNMKMEIAL